MRYNSELYKDTDMINFMKAYHQIKWMGHLFRTDDSNPSKEVIFGDSLYAKIRIG